MKVRVGFVQTVYFQEHGKNPTSLIARGFRDMEIESEERPYSRRMRLGSDWQPLDLGWLRGKGTSMIVLKSEEGMPEVGFGVQTAHIGIREGASLVMEPLAPVFVRGPAVIEYTVYPG